MNERLFLAINRCAGSSRYLDIIMMLISKKARFVYLFAVVLLLLRHPRYKEITMATGMSVGVTYVISLLIKLFFFKPRPFLNHGVFLLPPFPSKKSSSFPSKHTALAFAVSASIYVYHRAAGGILWFMSILVGLSRIWTGQHYPSDIAGSAVIGHAAAFLAKLTDAFWKQLASRNLPDL